MDVGRPNRESSRLEDAASVSDGGAHGRGRRLDEQLRVALSVVSFWAAIALPALYLPLLVHGFETADGLVAILGVLGLHLLSLLGGRRHRADAS